MDANAIRSALWGVVRLPVQIAALGIVLILLAKGAQWAQIPGVAAFSESFGNSSAFIGFLIFAIGLGFAIFLWWLAARYFTLLANPSITPEQIAGLKDLPLALPEGTVRALLALIVGIVGLPLLLFQSSLGLSDAIAGYVNGIIAGVFGFYFGSRTAAADTQTARQAVKTLDLVQTENKSLKETNTSLQQSAASVAAESTRPTRLGEALDRLNRHLALAEVLVDTLGPALPKGLIPAGAGDALKRARAVAESMRGLASGDVTEDTVKTVATAAADLIGGSPMGGLFGKAAGALPALGGAAGPLGTAALVLGLGWQLGSAEYRRWRARVLAAPYEPNLIDFGTITPTSAEIRMESCPIFSRAFATVRTTRPGFFASLIDMIQRDNAADRIWAAYGSDPSIFASRGEMQAGLDEFRRALLAEQSARDVTDSKLATVTAALNAADPAFRPGQPSVVDVNRLIDGAASVQGATGEQKAALEALVMMVGVMREKGIDPAQMLAELKP